MSVKRWGCENASCKKRGITELMQINPSSANYLPYCLKNKRLKTIDDVKVEKMKVNGAKWRCETCFAAFLKKNKLTSFYHLIEMGNETKESKGSHETNGTKETKEQPKEETRNAREIKSPVYENTLQESA